MSSQDQATKDMGEKLLKGWTMLNDVCPKGCNYPLMRDRDGNKYCCHCKIMIEDGPEEDEDEEMDVNTKLESINNAQQIEEPDFELSPNSTSIPPCPPPTKKSPIKSGNTVKDHAINTIYRKIHEYTIKLEKTKDEENAIKILQVIKECVSTIKSLETL